MKKFIDQIKNCALFNGIALDNIQAMMGCIGARVQHFDKSETILLEGEPAKYIGIVLSGRAQIIRDDYYGNRSIVANIEPTQMFGESFACAETPALPINVIAVENTSVLLLDCRRITKTCQNACAFHNQVIFNLMKMMANKNLIFNEKIEITSKRTTREKLMTYLSLQAKKQNSNTITIPYNRQELADFLEVERSGLSVEISKLCRAGVIEADKKTFRILE